MGQKAGSTILVVEDVAEIALHMQRVLTERDYNVISAPDAEQAIQVAEQASPVMILSDPDLPRFNQLLELVGRHDRLKEVPVVVIDVDEEQVGDGRVKVLPDFDALDNFVASL